MTVENVATLHMMHVGSLCSKVAVMAAAMIASRLKIISVPGVINQGILVFRCK